MARWIAAVGTAVLASLTLSVVGATSASANTAAGPQYRFLETERDGSAVAWACGTQDVYLYKPPSKGHAKVVELALARVSRLTATTFVLRGETAVSPQKPSANGPAIIIGFAELDPKWAGWTQRTMVADQWTKAFVTLNTSVAYIKAPATTTEWDRLRNTVLHELGHVAGLDHVDVASEVMFGKWNTGRVAWGAGDETGLKQLGCEAPAKSKARGTAVVSGDGLTSATGPVSFAGLGALTSSLVELLDTGDRH